MDNPFEEIIKRLDRIEKMLIEIKKDNPETWNDIEKKLNKSLNEIDMSSRLYNSIIQNVKLNFALKGKAPKLGHVVYYSKEDLCKFRNFGKMSMDEIEKIVYTEGLEFGMDVSKYGFNE